MVNIEKEILKTLPKYWSCCSIFFFFSPTCVVIGGKCSVVLFRKSLKCCKLRLSSVSIPNKDSFNVVFHVGTGTVKTTRIAWSVWNSYITDG